MDRLISEKQIINAIKAWAIPLQVSNSETIENLWVNGVCELIKAIPSADKWISVSEKLPEEGVDVLACFYTGERNYKMMVSRRSDYNYWSGVGRTGDMVAWMPLPHPYEPQESEVRNDKA